MKQGGPHRREALDCFAFDQKPRERCIWMITKSFRRSARRCHRRGCSVLVEDSALPKPLKSGNFTVAKAVTRWMPVKKGVSKWTHHAARIRAAE
jgi:hypothetical protein